MIQKLLKSQFFQNFSYLIILQVFNLLVNFMVYPIVLQRLGVDALGVMVLGQTIMQYIIIFVSYGFNISVIESLSVNRENPRISSEIVCAVLSIKLSFLLLSAVVYWLLMPFFEVMQLHFIFFFLAIAYCLEDSLVPIWYFQANEKMKQITIIGFITKVLYMSSVLVWVNHADDLYLMPIISGIAAIVSFLYSLKMMKQRGLYWVKPKWELSKRLIKESSPFFFMQIFSVIKLRSNNLFIYNYNGLSGTATNDLAEKFLLLIKVPFDSFSRVLFPNISKSKDYSKLYKMMGLSLVLAFCIYVCFYFASPLLVLYFDSKGQLPQAVEMSRILMFSIVFYCINSYAISIFIPLKKRYVYNIGGVFSSIVYLMICGVFIYFNYTFLFAFAYAFLLSEGLTMLYYLFQLYRLKL